MVMEDAMVENRLSQNQKPTGGTPYRLAAISLFIVATLVAVIVFDYGAADYNPHAPVCLQGGSLGSLPNECKLPVGAIVSALVIFIGGIVSAHRVWARR